MHPSSPTPPSPPGTYPPAAANAAVGTAGEEATGGALPYREMLARLHDALSPSLYLEIGVRHGGSLALAACESIGVDPAPDLDGVELAPGTRVFAMESDEFFREAAAVEIVRPPDLAFIDGMHRFEFALRDFMNIERLSAPGTLVVLDDIYPLHPAQAERERRTRVWTGDVWKLHACLAAMRPDLVLVPLDTDPTGLLLVAGLDRDSRVLWDGYDPLVRQWREAVPPPASVLQRRGAWSPSDPRIRDLSGALRRARECGATPDRLRDALRAVIAGGSPG
jgi:hypothetical protein